MIAKVLLVTLGSALCLWVWWTVPLKGLRAGEEKAVQAEEAAAQMESDAAAEPLMTADEARDVVEQYEEILIWVGNPVAPSREADYIDVCPMMEQRMTDIVGLLDEYTCSLGDAQPGIGGARVLSLTLKMTLLAEDDEQPAEKMERLILAVEDDPSMLLNSFSVTETKPEVSSVDGTPAAAKAYVEFNSDFYVLAEPPEDLRIEAEERAAERSAAFDSGALAEDLLKRHAQGEQREQGSE